MEPQPETRKRSLSDTSNSAEAASGSRDQRPKKTNSRLQRDSDTEPGHESSSQDSEVQNLNTDSSDHVGQGYQYRAGGEAACKPSSEDAGHSGSSRTYNASRDDDVSYIEGPPQMVLVKDGNARRPALLLTKELMELLKSMTEGLDDLCKAWNKFDTRQEHLESFQEYAKVEVQRNVPRLKRLKRLGRHREFEELQKRQDALNDKLYSIEDERQMMDRKGHEIERRVRISELDVADLIEDAFAPAGLMGVSTLYRAETKSDVDFEEYYAIPEEGRQPSEESEPDDPMDTASAPRSPAEPGTEYRRRYEDMQAAEAEFNRRKEVGAAEAYSDIEALERGELRETKSQFELRHLRRSMHLTTELIHAEKAYKNAKKKALDLGHDITWSGLSSDFRNGIYERGDDMSDKGWDPRDIQGPQGQPRALEWTRDIPDGRNISGMDSFHAFEVRRPHIDDWKVKPELAPSDSYSAAAWDRPKERIEMVREAGEGMIGAARRHWESYVSDETKRLGFDSYHQLG